MRVQKTLPGNCPHEEDGFGNRTEANEIGKLRSEKGDSAARLPDGEVTTFTRLSPGYGTVLVAGLENELSTPVALYDVATNS